MSGHWDNSVRIFSTKKLKPLAIMRYDYIPIRGNLIYLVLLVTLDILTPCIMIAVVIPLTVTTVLVYMR